MMPGFQETTLYLDEIEKAKKAGVLHSWYEMKRPRAPLFQAMEVRDVLYIELPEPTRRMAAIVRGAIYSSVRRLGRRISVAMLVGDIMKVRRVR